MSAPTTLAAENLVKAYNKRRVVNEVSLNVAQGEVVGLLGPNGAGKTTTFYMVVGLTKPDTGRVRFGERDITRQPMHQRARSGIGYLPQEPSVFRGLTVEQNILAILQMLPIDRRERESRLENLLEELGLARLRQESAQTLSGGERRRLEIARTLATKPTFILLDEPFAGIDPLAVGDIQQIVAQLKTKDIGILITDHNVRETLEITDRAYIIAQGQILEEGDTASIAASEKVRKFYLGEKFKF